MEYDPTQFAGSARYYRRGRPPYSEQLAQVVARELALDGTGGLLDVGSGPGTAGLALAPLFEHVTLLEPDPEMLGEARRRVETDGVPAVRLVCATAEELPSLGLSPMRAVVFGQSFHRVDRVPVAEAVHALLEPGGALLLITHDAAAGPIPSAPPGTTPIPHEEIGRLVEAYLGPERRSGLRPAASYSDERFAETLARTSFGSSRIVHAPGRRDIVRDADGVIAGYLSMSYAAPHLFGPRLEAFVADLRALLEQRSPDGRFWDWPGDTEIVIATRD